MHKRKARIAAKGYLQRERVDFDEVFSPVARMETVHIFLAIAAQMKWPTFQLDVKSAFLNRELQEEVYVTQPEGLIATSQEDMVNRFRKALYGLR